MLQTFFLHLKWAGPIRIHMDVFQFREQYGFAIDGVAGSTVATLEACATVTWQASAAAELVDGAKLIYPSGTEAVCCEVSVRPGDAGASPECLRESGADPGAWEAVCQLVAEAAERRWKLDLLSAWLRAGADAPWLRLNPDTDVTGVVEARPPESEAVSVELWFPFQDRRQTVRTSLEIAGEWTPRLDLAGRILFGQADQLQPLALLPAAFLRHQGKGEAPFHWCFEDQRTFPAGHAEPALALLLREHGFEVAHWPGGSVEARWVLRLCGDSAQVWLSSEDPGDPDSFDAVRRILFAAQTALRLWIPYQFFHDSKSFADRDRAWPMLVYEAMRPVECRSRAQYSYDVMEPEPILRAFHWASKPLRDNLRLVRTRIEASGQQKLIREYPLRNLSRIFRWIRKLPRHFGRLMVGESQLLKKLVWLLEQGQRLRPSLEAGAEPPRQLRQLGRGIEQDLHAGLRKQLNGFPSPGILSLLLMTATWGLTLARRQPARFEGFLEIRDLASGAVKCSGRPIFYANSRRRRPLT